MPFKFPDLNKKKEKQYIWYDIWRFNTVTFLFISFNIISTRLASLQWIFFGALKVGSAHNMTDILKIKSAAASHGIYLYLIPAYAEFNSDKRIQNSILLVGNKTVYNQGYNWTTVKYTKYITKGFWFNSICTLP